jgi:hypothetical protein
MSESGTLPGHLVTTAEAVEMLGRPLRTVHNWVNTGRLTPAGKLPGLRGAYLFNRCDVEALAAAEAAEVAS